MAEGGKKSEEEWMADNSVENLINLLYSLINKGNNKKL